MKSLLDALQEGRLIELPDADKERSLRYLSTLIEAVPDFRAGVDFTAAVMQRETAANTGVTLGWACPHGRVPGEGELLCAVGWSPTGIVYGAPDNKPVHIVVMHYVPDSQRNAYLREISRLVRAIQGNPALGELSGAQSLPEVRSRFIDLLTAALESATPDVKARMIQLETKQAISALAEALPDDILAGLKLVPLTVVIVPGSRPVVLSLDREAVAGVEAAHDIAAPLAARVPFDVAGLRVAVRSVSSFAPDRLLYECLAVRLGPEDKR